MKMYVLYFAMILFAPLACVKVPAEVVVASRAVGAGLDQGQQMTLMWIEAAYREAQTRMEAELKREWYPRYQQKLLAALTPDEAGALARGLQSPQHGKPLQQWQEALMDQYLERQKRLAGELNAARDTVIEGVKAWYAELALLQGSITGYLESGRELEVSREQVLAGLDALRGRDPKLDRALDATRGVWNLLQRPANENLTENLERLLADPQPQYEGEHDAKRN